MFGKIGGFIVEFWMRAIIFSNSVSFPFTVTWTWQPFRLVAKAVAAPEKHLRIDTARIIDQLSALDRRPIPNIWFLLWWYHIIDEQRQLFGEAMLFAQTWT